MKMSSNTNATINNAYQGETDPHFATKAIHVGQEADNWESGAVVAPIFTATTFKQKSPGDAEYVYGRSGNPSRRSLENCVAALENGKHGFCFASGLAALDTVIHTLRSGDHVVCGDDVYGGTARYFRQVIPCQGIEVSFVDTSNLDNVRNSIKNNTKMVWVETPANPLMKLTDIVGVKQILNESHDGILFVVDNTFMSPYFQRPLNLGADVVLQSLTKYINGHCDVIMGALVTNRDDLAEKIKFLQNSTGAVPSPFDCYMVNRGVKTLAIRMKEHMRNGLAVAKYLEAHPCIEKVLHPGLPSHPQHKIALKQTSGCSGMLAVYLKGGLEESKKFLKSLKVFTLAESLGGYKSLAELPSVMTHASIPREHRESVGITDSLIRLSVGIETLEDILEDLDQALRIAVKPTK